MFLNVVSGTSERSAKTRAAGLIVATRELWPLFLRAAHSLSRLVQRIAAFAERKIVDRRLGTQRWCDSTERALIDDLTAQRRNSFTRD
jgi:hypothetical protein